MRWFKSLINLILYGNFWIAFCALAMYWQTLWIIEGKITPSSLGGFIFFSTLFLYAIHRIIGIEKMTTFEDTGRFAIISQFRNHILLYGITGAIFSAYFFFWLKFSSQAILIILAVLAIAYTLPVFGEKKRLRDFNYLKIFLIAFVWGSVTVVLPLSEKGMLNQPAYWWLFVERSCFIFAITIPFDIRDIPFDRFSGVKTLPGRFGVRRSVTIALAALVLAGFSGVGIYILDIYTAGQLAGLFLSLMVAAIVIYRAPQQKSDYYFTGLTDGMMLLQPLLIFIGSIL